MWLCVCVGVCTHVCSASSCDIHREYSRMPCDENAPVFTTDMHGNLCVCVCVCVCVSASDPGRYKQHLVICDIQK